jgi:hypothetical protein
MIFLKLLKLELEAISLPISMAPYVHNDMIVLASYKVYTSKIFRSGKSLQCLITI